MNLVSLFQGRIPCLCEIKTTIDTKAKLSYTVCPKRKQLLLMIQEIIREVETFGTVSNCLQVLTGGNFKKRNINRPKIKA